MVVFRRGPALIACPPPSLVGALIASAAIAAVAGVSAAPAYAAPAMCRVVKVDFTPGGIPAGPRVPPGGTNAILSPEITPQMVAWIEKPSGEFVDTIYVTHATGRYGLGNRPGRFDFNSGPGWPYGRRTTVFPVWSNRQPIKFPQVVFRDDMDDNLSHAFNESSVENHFCRPVKTDESLWDAVTCSSTVYTDKGVFGTETTGYPPRADLTPVAGTDSPSVAMYKAMNPFDAVTQATPKLGSHADFSWPIPQSLVAGDYVLLMEVALEQDFNETYNHERYPSPPRIAYGEYGIAYRGQPSVIYRVPFQITDGQTLATTSDYVGYGDPDGRDGAIRPPDATITTDTPNSGALRLLLTASGGQTYRVRVDARSEEDYDAPGSPGDMVVTDPQSSRATLTFRAPGDDGMIGTVRGYEVRYLVGGGPITADNFEAANDVAFEADIVESGQVQAVTIKNLLPETEYTVAVRAFDDCYNTSVVASTSFLTAPRQNGVVEGCFVATAAWGSALANDVEMLRRFRDSLLRRSVLGELAVEAYYTFGPPVAGVVGESDLLRATARDLLTPIVERVRGLRW